MSNIRLKIFFSFLVIILSQALPQDLERIEPPFWWAGFKSDELQLMVYGENISKLKPDIEGSKIIIEKVLKNLNVNPKTFILRSTLFLSIKKKLYLSTHM